MKQNALIAYGTAGLIALTAGGRLHYIEKARWNMQDYDRKVSSLNDNRKLLQEWESKVLEIENKIDGAYHAKVKEIKSAENCEKDFFLRDFCLYPGKLEREFEKRKEQEVYKLMGTYEDWGKRRIALNKHQWVKYPADLQWRIRNGERGLMLGKFWEYIL